MVWSAGQPLSAGPDAAAGPPAPPQRVVGAARAAAAVRRQPGTHGGRSRHPPHQPHGQPARLLRQGEAGAPPALTVPCGLSRLRPNDIVIIMMVECPKLKATLQNVMLIDGYT